MNGFCLGTVVAVNWTPLALDKIGSNIRLVDNHLRVWKVWFVPMGVTWKYVFAFSWFVWWARSLLLDILVSDRGVIGHPS